MLEEKRSEFLKLFQEFAETYPKTLAGQSHVGHYEKEREEAKENLETIIESQNQGKDVTEEILHKLLPYAGTRPNQEKGWWISIAPTFNNDVRAKYEAAGWVKNENWPEVAKSILNFIRRCFDNPEQLSSACTDFSASLYSKGFQAGTLTPILHALRPDDYILINNKSRQVYNYFSGTSYSQNLLDYPLINNIARSLILEIAEDIYKYVPRSVRKDDFFDMFAHWLVAIKKYNFGSRIRYWKIAPGENAWHWDECRNGGFIAIGWNDLGNLSGMSRSEFEARRDELLARNKDWDKVGTEQVWKFAQIKEGDRILANRGTTEVLGFGTVVGPVYFVPGETYGHRIPVEWEDLTPRRINEPGWKRTLIELTQEKFDDIYNHTDSTDIYKIFKDKEEAEWAFSLLRETIDRLGVKNSNDERFAITCPSGGAALHLNFGQWLVLGFSSPEAGPDRIEMALLADQTSLTDKLESFEFAQGENESSEASYKPPALFNIERYKY
jgi:5-methylcytosine-specific restriction enzyme B